MIRKSLENIIFKTKLHKGEVGEKILIKKLKEKYPNYDILTHVFEKSHWIDFVLMNKENNDIIFCEVKTKAKWAYYPYYGFNIDKYKNYLKLHNKTGLEVYFYFIDDSNKEIRFLPISKAIKIENSDTNIGKLGVDDCYIYEKEKTINWKTKHTIKFGEISDEEYIELNKINQQIKLYNNYDTNHK